MKYINFLLVVFLVNFCFAGDKNSLNQTNSEVSIDTMIGQMIIVGFKNEEYEDLKYYLKSGKIGGVLFLERNIDSKADFSNLTNDIISQNYVIAPFLCIDEEGGSVSRFKKIDKNYRSPAFVAKNLSPNQAYEMYLDMAKMLKFYHINVNFAPVVDVFNPDSEAIGIKNRAYSRNVDVITTYANEFIKAMKDENIISVMKHFPGHGNALRDTHTEISIVKNYDFMELKPYFEAIKNKKIEMIMSSHVIIPSLDPKNSASFSKIILNDLLRDKFKFNGIVISDDLLMIGAGDESVAKKAIMAIKAGSDIVLISDMFEKNENLVKNIHKEILKAVENGEISYEKIKTSFDRIITLKRNFGLHSKS